MTLSDTAAVTSQMSDAINSGHPQKAISLGSQHIKTLSDSIDSAEFFFQLSLAYRLDNQPGRVGYCERRATNCSNFTKQMKGDFLRDQALSLIRTRQLDGPMVIDLINRAREIHAGDTNRLAALDMTEGRRFYALGDYQRAMDCFNRASETWRTLSFQMEPYDVQWRRNNRFHRLCAAAHLGDVWAIHDAGNTIIMDSGERDRKRKKAAWLIMHFPRLGIRLVDRKYR